MSKKNLPKEVSKENPKKIEKNAENLPKDITKEIKEKILSEVEKEVKTSILEGTKKYKEDIKIELIEDVNNQVADLLKKEEKRMLKSKNIAIFKRNIVIIGLFSLLVYFGYCLYDIKYFDFMKSDCERAGNCYVGENGNTNDNNEQEPTIVKDKKWYIDNFGYLLDKVKLTLNQDNVSAYYMYSSDRRVNEMKTSMLLNLAYNQVSSKNIKTNSVNITVEGSELQNAFENLFGSLTQYKPQGFTYNCLQFKYEQDKDRYTAENKKCEKSNNKIIEEIEDMYEEGNVLYIITNATIYNENENSFYTFDNLYEPVVTNVKEEDLKGNARKLNNYQYQFKKVDDKYYLDAIVKLR